MALIDLSHTVEDGMITYRGLPAPVVCDFMSYEGSRSHYAPGTEFQIAEIRMVANTGTYVDVPSHRFADGKDLSELPLTSLAHLEAVVVRARTGERRIDVDAFQGLEIRDRAVLVATGWDTGAPTSTSKAIRSSPRPRRGTWPGPARAWWASTR